MASPGKFITFEGGEGCGKSTHIQRVANRLRDLGRNVIVAFEPGGTAIGDQIRHVLLANKQSQAMVPPTELLLFCASRAQLVREVIRPALARGDIVLSDRFADSTTVYQGVGRQLPARMVAMLNQFVVGDCWPDLTILIDLDPRIGLERARGRELFDRMENESLEFHQRIRRGYLALARRQPRRVKVVDGSPSLDRVSELIWEQVERVL